MSTRDPQKRAMCGRYELLARIGVGGMAEVFRARLPGPRGFEKIVVIKKILPSLAEDPTAIQMLIEEAKIAAAANHDNIAQVFELGQSNDGAYFIVLEYIDGVDLAQVVSTARRRGMEIPVWLSVHIYCEVLEALAFLHELRDSQGRRLNVVHRDVTPSNVFISRFGKVKLGDFGIVQFAGKQVKTEAGQLKGKIGYMSPEQISSKPLDQRSDIFAVGVGLFECLTLRPMFSGSDPQVMLAICDAPRPRAAELSQRVPPALDQLVARAVEIDRGDRFQNALEMQSALFEIRHALRPSIRRGEVRRALDAIMIQPAVPPDEEDDTASIREDAVATAPSPPSSPGFPSAEASTADVISPPIVAPTLEERKPRGRVRASSSGVSLQFGVEDAVTIPGPRPATLARMADPIVGDASPTPDTGSTTPMFHVRAGANGPVSQVDWTSAFERLRDAALDGRPFFVSADGKKFIDVAELSRLAGLDLIAGSADAPSNVTVVGTLEECSIVAAIGMLARDRHTGTLAIARTAPVTGEWYEIHILDGKPTRVATNVEAMQLPAMLVNEGLIAPERLPKLILSVIREKKPLDELVEAEMGTGLGRATFMSARLAALLSWEGADYTFSVDYSTQTDPPFARTLLLPLVWIVERTNTLEQLAALTRDRVTRKFHPAERFDEAIAELDLDPQLSAMVEKLRGGMSIAEALEPNQKSAKMLMALAYVLSEAELLT